MKRWLLATICTIALIVIVILLAFFGSVNFPQYSTDLAVGLTLLGVPIWAWALKPRIKKIEIKEKPTVSTVSIPNQQEFNYSSTEKTKSDNFLSILLPKDKTLKHSIYLINENEPQKLNFDNSLLDEIYEKARKAASLMFYDSKLSSFHIQVYPFESQETDDSIIKSVVNIHFIFYSENAKKVCRMIFNEVGGVRHMVPDEDVTINFDRMVFSKVPWRGVNWKAFLSKAYDTVKRLSVSKKTYYDVFAASHDKELPWAITFFDGFNGKRRSYNWNGKGIDERRITLQGS
jgi:hypothetical protein